MPMVERCKVQMADDVGSGLRGSKPNLGPGASANCQVGLRAVLSANHPPILRNKVVPNA